MIITTAGLDNNNGVTFSGSAKLYVLPNGYDIFFDAIVSTNGPAGGTGDVTIVPISTFSYVVPK
jgi:hypothetical protein